MIISYHLDSKLCWWINAASYNPTKMAIINWLNKSGYHNNYEYVIPKYGDYIKVNDMVWHDLEHSIWQYKTLCEFNKRQLTEAIRWLGSNCETKNYAVSTCPQTGGRIFYFLNHSDFVQFTLTWI
jgi:hypothetical protein